MSELRQRKGEKAETSAETQEVTQVQKEELAQKLMQLFDAQKPNPKPGTSKDAKAFKDELQKDPYNMELIYQLGVVYAQDQQWDRCANVMLRGFKRVSELEDEADRFDFLVVLCQASLKLKMYRQALAVVNDVAEPEDVESRLVLNKLKCQVYCSNGDMQKGLKAFSAATEGADFEGARTVWAQCAHELKKANAWGVTKEKVMALAKTEDEKKQLEVMEKLLEFQALQMASDEDSGLRKYLICGLSFFVVILFLCLLYFLEQKSLQKLDFNAKK